MLYKTYSHIRNTGGMEHQIVLSEAGGSSADYYMARAMM